MEFTVNGKVFSFDNMATYPREGFNHFSTLCINGIEVAKAKVHYINRTWEAYQFQTTMGAAVRTLQGQMIDSAIHRYQHTNGITRFKRGQRQAVIDQATQSPEYQELELLIKTIYLR